jgi:hypothetical protein
VVPRQFLAKATLEEPAVLGRFSTRPTQEVVVLAAAVLALLAAMARFQQEATAEQGRQVRTVVVRSLTRVAVAEEKPKFSQEQTA